MAKKKQKSYVIVHKENSPNIYGSFSRTKEGLSAAKVFMKKIQKEYPDKLFIEKR